MKSKHFASWMPVSTALVFALLSIASSAAERAAVTAIAIAREGPGWKAATDLS